MSLFPEKTVDIESKCFSVLRKKYIFLCEYCNSMNQLLDNRSNSFLQDLHELLSLHLLDKSLEFLIPHHIELCP